MLDMWKKNKSISNTSENIFLANVQYNSNWDIWFKIMVLFEDRQSYRVKSVVFSTQENFGLWKHFKKYSCVFYTNFQNNNQH